MHKQFNNNESHDYKIMMNSLYGTMSLRKK